MVFNSWEFAGFFVIVWAIYISLNNRSQNILILTASYIFYSWWDWKFLSLILISTCVDFYCSKNIEKGIQKKANLLISITVNLGILCFFKYFNFFTDSAACFLELIGFNADLPTLNIILPIGISFYTFQTLAYTIDVYRGNQKATHDFLTFAVFVTYFPQLVAGPVERASRLLVQIQNKRSIKPSHIYIGLQLILMGYFKKVFIADGVAPVVDIAFSNFHTIDSLGLICGLYLFALQIYGDFSGYTDMARGISKCLGIELNVNFNQPYLATNITEFWRRWHISLSTWLRDYVYISLGGNRQGNMRTYLNLMLTMLLGGLWHGAGFKFVIWGGIHGIYLSLHKLISGNNTRGTSKPEKTFPSIFKWLVKIIITFNLVSFAWLFFRADNFSEALEYLQQIFSSTKDFSYLPLVYLLFYGFWVVVVDLLCWSNNAQLPFKKSWAPAIRGSLYGFMAILVLYVGERNDKIFIYFQF